MINPKGACKRELKMLLKKEAIESFCIPSLKSSFTLHPRFMFFDLETRQ